MFFGLGMFWFVGLLGVGFLGCECVWDCWGVGGFLERVYVWGIKESVFFFGKFYSYLSRMRNWIEGFFVFGREY